MTVPVTGQTPLYKLEYPVPGEPLHHTRAKLERTMKGLESVLAARGVPAPSAPDLAALAARTPTRVLWVPGLTTAQSWADSHVGAWGTPRYGAAHWSAGVFTVPTAGEWHLRCRLYPGSGATDLGAFIARLQFLEAGLGTWSVTKALTSHSGRFFPNESSIHLDYDGDLPAGMRIRVLLYSNAAARPGLVGSGLQGNAYFSAQYLGAAPAA